jgi:histidyl-tRNA synthetase
MSQKTEPLNGTSDIFPDEAAEWRRLETAAHAVFSNYGYGELRTPIFERTSTFTNALGDETDVVQKEMYTFERGNRSMTLRPEGTAGVMRALVNNGIPQGDERRVYYLGPMFRGERPAAGRKRQFHQIGVECVGKVAPLIDVECIHMLVSYLDAIGIRDTKLLVNTLGSGDDRQNTSAALRNHFADHVDGMCEDCQRRFGTNVWRMLDCKQEHCNTIIATIPSMHEVLGDESREYFVAVCAGLDALGINYKIDPTLVRGLDYYAHTVFEVVYDGIGAQNALAGGGRYEILVRGAKKPVCGVGFAAGMERLLMTRESLDVDDVEEQAADFYLVSLGQAALIENLKLAAELRGRGAIVRMDLESRSMKAQMRGANNSGAAVTLIRGDSELETGKILWKNMATSEQEEVNLPELETRFPK